MTTEHFADPPDGDGPADPPKQMVWLRRGVWAVLAAGFLAFLVRGADNPADPVLVPGSPPASVSASRSRLDPLDPRSGLQAPTTLSAVTTASTAPPSTSSTSAPTSSSAPAPVSDPAIVAGTGSTTSALPGPDSLAAPAEGSGRSPLAGFGETGFRVTDSAGSTHDGVALLAADAPSRQRGLMEQTDLRGYDGMVFRIQSPTTATFTMRKTRIPLSVAFFDLYGLFVSAVDMQPCPDQLATCPSYRASGSYVHAIEVNQGDLGRLGIGPGAVLSFPRP